MGEGRIAQGYEAVAINLEKHIRNYTPKTWTAPISDVMLIPTIFAEKAKGFTESYRQGTLEQDLQEDEKKFFAEYMGVRAAVRDFFDKGLHKKYVD